MNIPNQITQVKHRFPRTPALQKQRTLRTRFQIGVLLALVSASAAKAAVYTYVGTGGSSTTPVSDNFSTGFSPSIAVGDGTSSSTTADTLIFGGNATYTATDDFTSTVNANVLSFTNTAAVTLARGTSTGATNSFTLGGTAPSISLTNTALVTNNLDLVLGNNITVSGSGSMTLNGTISDGGAGYGLTMNGTGSLTLNAATNILGTVTLNYGSVNLGASNVLSSNSALVFGTKSTNIALNFGTTQQTVASIASGEYLQNQTFYGSGAASLTVGGNNATTTFYGRLDGVALIKNGTGKLTLSCKVTYTGSALTVNAGTVVLSSLAAGIEMVNNSTSGATVNGGTLQLAGGYGDQIQDNNLVTMTGGTFDLNGQTETIGGLVSTGGGTVTNTSATATGVLTVGGSTATSTYAGTITDGTSQETELIKAGTGIQVLSGVNTYTGGTMVNAGTLELGAFASSPNSGAGTTVASGATLAVAVGGTSTITSANVATLSTNVGTGFASGSFLGFDTTGGNFTESDNLTGAYGLTKLGANVLTLSGANSYTGPTTLSAGTLVASGAVGALPANSAVNMVAGTTLSFRNDASTIAQGNSITLTNASTVATAPTIDVRNNGGTTTGSVVALGALNNGTATTALLNYINFTGANGYTASFTGLALPGVGGQTTYLNPTTTSVSIGSVTNQITSTTSTVYNSLALNGTSTGNAITGVIADSSVHASAPAGTVGNTYGATAISVNPTVTGLGTTSVWTFTGANTYSGTTTIANGGALILNTPSTTSAGTVAVNNGGTLLGNGYTPTGLLTVASGAYLAPGATASSTITTAASAGVLHVGALTLTTTTGAGSNFNILLSDNGSTTGAGAGTNYSQLDASGTVRIAGKLNLNISGNLVVGDKFFILLNSGTNTTSGTFSNITGSSFTSGGDTFSINYADNGDSGNISDDISLTFTGVTPVPEPSTYVGGLLTLAAGAWTLRRRMPRGVVRLDSFGSTNRAAASQRQVIR